MLILLLLFNSEFQAKECQNHVEQSIVGKLPVEVIAGKKNLEVRPTLVNKGEIVKHALGQNPKIDFLLCAGDDRTDEDMFRVLRSNITSSSEKILFTISVGSADKNTLAAWYVETCEELIDIINTLDAK